MSGGAYRRLAYLEHGPYSDSRECGYLPDHHRGDTDLPGSEQEEAQGELEEAAHAAGAGEAADRWPPSKLLLESGGTDPESRGYGSTVARDAGLAQRLQRAEGVGPAVGVQHEEYTAAEDIPGGEAGIGDEGVLPRGWRTTRTWTRLHERT